MKFEPGSFYFGVIDFFSIMLPGGVIAFFFSDAFEAHVFGKLFPPLQPGPTKWVAFLFAAYLFGHIVFLIGSYLDFVYDPIRRLIWPKETDHAFKQADKLKNDRLEAGRKNAINTFQWARAILALEHPTAIAEVARLEADSKFFRSLVVVLAILAGAAIVREMNYIIFLGFVILLLLSYWRYTERRYKSTEQAYRYVIVLDTQKKSGKS